MPSASMLRRQEDAVSFCNTRCRSEIVTEQGMLEARSRMLPAKQLTHQDALFVGKGVTIDFRPAWALGSNNCRVWV